MPFNLGSLTVGAAYCINLDRQPQKYEKMLATAPFPLLRFSAIDGSLVKDRPWFMTNFMIGCLASHRALWKKISEEPLPCIVLEDDCVFSPTFNEEIAVVTQTLPKDYECAFLGFSSSDVNHDTLAAAAVGPLVKERMLRHVNEDWSEPGFIIGSHAYVLTPAGAKKLVNNTTTYHADAVLVGETSLRIYCVRKPLVTQALIGYIPYSNHMTWEWILLEPVIGIHGYSLRTCHLVAALVATLYVCFRSPNVVMRNTGLSILGLLIGHYLLTNTHMRYNHGELDNHAAATFCATDKEASLRMLRINDLLAVSTAIFFMSSARVPPRAKYALAAALFTKPLISNLMIRLFPNQVDSSCECNERALNKRHIFDVCADGKPSGHIIPSLAMARQFPALGLPLVALQTMTILCSNSHHAEDIFSSIPHVLLTEQLVGWLRLGMAS
jgi:GR25 family glycosyltransferase involved in LPS biosynthesis